MTIAIYNPTTNKVFTFVTKAKGTLPEGYVFIPEEELPPGWTKEEPVLEVPQTVPLWTIRAVINIAGLTTQVTDRLNALPEPQKTVAFQQWEYGNFIDRQHPLIVSLGESLGLTVKQIDEMFIQADSLS